MSATAEDVSQETIYQQPRIDFLRAWKRAVALVGSTHTFGSAYAALHQVSNHRELTPRVDVIRKSLPNRSNADAAFLAALVSFYNKHEGQKLINKNDLSLGDMALTLSTQQRNILADLIIHYRGW